MLVISLDEYGQFEGYTLKRSMVAGLVYACETAQDIREERQRIVDYLRDVCQQCGAQFPRDLHPVRDGGAVLNQDKLAAVEDRLRNTFHRFLKKAEPYGTYYLYAVVAEPEGVSRFNAREAGNLLWDDYAGNRYLHMSQMAVRNLIINNPIIEDSSYRMDLATRVIPLNTRNLEVQADQLGIPRVRDKNGNLLALGQLTDANTYISTLSAAVMENQREGVDFNLKVQSIQYEDKETTNLAQAFLLLADMACSLLQPALKGDDKAAQRLLEQVNEFTTHTDNMIWCYHDVDFLLRQALEHRVNGQWFQCLETLHRISSGKNAQSEFYRDNWVNVVLQQLREDMDPQLATDAARSLSLYCRQPNLQVDKAWFIAEHLEKLISEYRQEPTFGQCSYLLSSCMMTLCNHAGQHEQATRYYERCVERAKSAPLEDYLELRNAHSVSLIDQLKYGAALSNTRKTLEIEELADALRARAFGEDCASIHHGRTLSQMGQCYAFLKQYDQAADCFQRALEMFPDNPVDQQITRSYLLHCYIESNNKKDYANLAAAYFGTGDLKKQLENIFELENTSCAFALLVYMKAWYRFYPSNLPPRIAKEHLNNIVKRGAGQVFHPWELIFKYVALLADLANKPEIAQAAREALEAMASDAPSGLMLQICREALDTVTTKKEKTDSLLTYMYR